MKILDRFLASFRKRHQLHEPEAVKSTERPRRQSNNMATCEHCIVVGAGINGSCIANELTSRGMRVEVIEAVAIASSSSGKAGGFLASSFCDQTPTEQLARVGFEMHCDLAEELDEDTGFRRLDTFSVEVGQEKTSDSPLLNQSRLAWLKGCPVTNINTIGSMNDTAQVHPRLLTNALMTRAIACGAKLRIGRVSKLLFKNYYESKKRYMNMPVVAGVELDDGTQILANLVVLTMGAWTEQAREWLPILPNVNICRAHSIVVRPYIPVGDTALFIEGRDKSCEIYPRPYTDEDAERDQAEMSAGKEPSLPIGEIYVCGMSDSPRLPDTAAEVVPKPGACEELLRRFKSLAPQIQKFDVLTEQACLLPAAYNELPLIGAIPTVSGVYICTGHSCWGILMAPPSAKALAELIIDGSSSTINISAFDPVRLLDEN